MNSIMMIVAAVIAILLVFIIFSQDDHEDEVPGNSPSRARDPLSPTPLTAIPPEVATVSPAGLSQIVDPPSSPPPIVVSQTPLPPPFEQEAGSEDDLKFRLVLDDQMPVPTTAKTANSVAGVVQIRFPENMLCDPNLFIPLLEKSETVLDPDKAPFPFSVFLSHQTDRLLLFGFDEDSDDPVFEALVTAYDIIFRFKKMLENDERLMQSKVRIAVGISTGPVTRISRGSIGPVSHAGKAVYLAETLAEAAGDFQIYVDEEVHCLALPLFDFREWKPMKLRSPLPNLPFFEVVGWNKKDEIFAYANHKDPYPRRAVAVSYRYLDFDDLTPLLGLLSDGDERVSQEALSTISEIGDERALGILKKILHEAKKPDFRSAIIGALGKVGNEEIIPVLLAASKDVNWQVRFQAVRSLYQIGGKNAIRHLELLTNDGNGVVRAAIHQILFQQNKREEHLLALRDLLTDLSQRARKAAFEGLIDIGSTVALNIIASGFSNQEPDLKRHILRLLMRTKSSVLYQTFLNLFHDADEKDRGDIVTSVRRAKLTE